MSRHLGMICEECDIVESVRDGTGMVEPDPTVLTDDERDRCVQFLIQHANDKGVYLCLFDVRELARA